MGYLHIENLYKDQRIQSFKEVYCLEKIHGTSAYIAWKDQKLKFFSGGAKHQRFVELFDQEAIVAKFEELVGYRDSIIFGEIYGASIQGMKDTYGLEFRFVAFDVKVGETWLAVPQAEELVRNIGLEFVPWEKSSSETEALNKQRDAPSVQAARNGIKGDRKREGIVIRPPFECRLNNGARLIAKHKSDEFKETKTPREVSPEELKVLEEAYAIAQEWVTPMRLDHVLDKLPGATDLEHTGLVMRAMVEDILREAKGEIVNSKAARKAIGRATGKLWRAKVTTL